MSSCISHIRMHGCVGLGTRQDQGDRISLDHAVPALAAEWRVAIDMASVGDVPGDRLSRIQAELAAKEREALEAIKEDLCQWLGTVLSLDVTPHSFLDALDTGVSLCRLASLIQQSARAFADEGESKMLKVPVGDVACNPKAERGTFYARDNTSNFIDWCRALGVEESVIFESDGLVLHKDEKRVILCLLDVARFAEKVGISPPQLVQMEREIDSLERRDEDSEVGKKDSPPETEKEEERGRKEGSGKGEPGPPEAKRLKTEGEPRETGNLDSLQKAKTGGQSSGGKQRTPEPEIRKRPKKEETFDDKVGRILGQCTCREGLRVTKCGHGKFVLQGECLKKPGEKKVTLYARLLSDRIMVRVGGGWDTLDHLLLKLDPCRLDLSVRSGRGGGQSTGEEVQIKLGKHKRED